MLSSYCMQELKRNSHVIAAGLHGQSYSKERLVDPTSQFLFQVETRSEYVKHKKCRYETQEEYAIQLPLDVENLTLNSSEVENSREIIKLQNDKGQDLSNLTPVEPILALGDCFAKWASDEVIENVVMPGLPSTSSPKQSKDNLLKRMRFQSFPDYLTVVTQRFGLNEDWTPKKLQVRICVPKELDLTNYRATGPQPSETLIDKESGLTLAQEAIISELVDFGYSRQACRVAVSKSLTKEAAVELLLTKGESLCKEAVNTKKVAQVCPNFEHLLNLQNMGFSEQHSRLALISTDNDLERAVDWLFNHPDESHLAEGSAGSTLTSAETITDGSGKYELWAFISHIGKSPACGHYVAHIKKIVDDKEQWVIFDDERVALSVQPPIDYGYIYFFRRK